MTRKGTAVRDYTFRALITAHPAARGRYAPGFPGRRRVRCVLQSHDRSYFPAVISRDQHPPARPGEYAVISVLLAGGEAAAFFAPGQRFAIWADAMVGHSVRGYSLLGHGVISGGEIRLSAGDHGAPGTADGPARDGRMPPGSVYATATRASSSRWRRTGSTA